MKLLNHLITKILLFIFIAVVLGLSVKGVMLNPTVDNLSNGIWYSGPFELSPERGRFVLTMSIVENESFNFAKPLARFATPDVGYLEGKYVSLFAPAVSFLIVPGYLFGKMFNASQVGAFGVIAVFALFNAYLVRLLAIHLKSSRIAANIASLIFVFATPAFAYSSTLYQHHISTFLILTSLYLALRFKSFISLGIIWFLVAASIPVDYPNLFLMLPIAIYALLQLLWVEKTKQKIFVKIKPLYFLAFIFTLFPLLFYVWFSQNSYGKPLQLAGTVKSIDVITEDAEPASSNIIVEKLPEVTQDEYKKSAVGFFKTRNLLNGFFVHLFSPDRGIIFFSPIMLLGVLGFLALRNTGHAALPLFTGIIALNFLLYSMWGDPWGGWAFGSRYLIPTYALLAVFIAVAVTKFRRSITFMTVLVLVSIFSTFINTLGALTSNANPPKIQVLALEQQTGKEEKYTYERNWDYLLENGSKSFVYNTYLKEYISPLGFYLAVAGSISFVIVLLVLAQIRRKNG